MKAPAKVEPAPHRRGRGKTSRFAPLRLGAGFLLISLVGSSATADESRRFFDFTPLSADNPAVATIDGTRAIPLSELRAYRNAERLQAKTDTFAQKRALLDDLVSEFLFVDECYRTGIVESPRFAKQMEATRTLILTDFMTTRALHEKKPGETGDAAAVLADRLFDAAPIDISNEAYAIVKHAAKLLDATTVASQRGPLVDSPEAAAAKLYTIINAAPEAVIVRYADKTLSIHEILSLYSGLPAPRPNVQAEAGFVAMIKPLITPELMAQEAVRRGIAVEREFQDKLVQNRNALLRFHAHGAIEARANDVLRGADLETRLQAWYHEHRELYPAEPFATLRPRVLGDFSVDLRDRLIAEKAQALRKVRVVTIDDEVLKRLD